LIALTEDIIFYLDRKKGKEQGSSLPCDYI